MDRCFVFLLLLIVACSSRGISIWACKNVFDGRMNQFRITLGPSLMMVCIFLLQLIDEKVLSRCFLPFFVDSWCSGKTLHLKVHMRIVCDRNTANILSKKCLFFIWVRITLESHAHTLEFTPSVKIIRIFLRIGLWERQTNGKKSNRLLFVTGKPAPSVISVCDHFSVEKQFKFNLSLQHSYNLIRAR